MADNTIKIGGELESMATGKIVAAASAIKDKSRNKTQEVINGDVEAAIAEQSVLFEALSEETSEAVESASKSAREAKQYLADLQEAITELPDGQAVSAQVAINEVDIAGLKSGKADVKNTEDVDDILYITDDNGNAVAKLAGGNIKMKDFDSSQVAPVKVVYDYDFLITDANGYVIAAFKNGQLQTQKFNSSYSVQSLNSDSLSDFIICDENGYVVVALKNGQLQTQKFNSSYAAQALNSDSLSDFIICDSSGNVIVEFVDGHIKTKNFDSSQGGGGGGSSFFSFTQIY